MSLDGSLLGYIVRFIKKLGHQTGKALARLETKAIKLCAVRDFCHKEYGSLRNRLRQLMPCKETRQDRRELSKHAREMSDLSQHTTPTDTVLSTAWSIEATCMKANDSQIQVKAVMAFGVRQHQHVNECHTIKTQL